MTDYKYNCSTLEYLRLESGLIPVPDDSVDTYIVVQPETGDIGLVEFNKEYRFNGSDWEFVREVEEDFDNDFEI